MRSILANVALAGVVSVGSHAQGDASIDRDGGPCVTSSLLERMARDRIPTSWLRGGDAPLLYTFYPMAGTLYQDITTGNFVDLDPNAGAVKNYLCATYGNDGHAGCDTGGLFWEQMAIGVPVYAVGAGQVVAMHDGDPDMNTSCQPGGNYVILDHGEGRETWYLHFKKGSVAVALGEVVQAGRQLGLVGSSGCSFGPHLHFQSMQNGVVYEPFAGACRPGGSGWVSQVDPPTGVFIRDFGVTSQDLGGWPGVPARPPVNAQLALGDPFLYYWIQLGNLPANSTWKERYVRPSGTIEFELGPFGFGNPTVFAHALYWFKRDVGGMHTTPGTWRIQFEINGVQVIDAPIEVVPTVNPSFNRPPEPIAAVFSPAAPGASDVVHARVSGSSAMRDLDWDVVRYRYEWFVNGAKVRDMVSAAMSDAIAVGTAQPGDLVVCTITPGDGKVNASPISIDVTIAGGCYPDCDGDTVLSIDDFICFQTYFAIGDPYGDCDGDTVLSIDDFICFQTYFAIGC